MRVRIELAIGLIVLAAGAVAPLQGQSSRLLDLAGVHADFQAWGNEAPSGNYALGSAVATGDVNGDGLIDLIVGNHEETVGANARAGEVYVFFGRANRPRQTVDLKTQAADVTIQGVTSGARFGRSLALGDVNGDGILDVIVGQPFLGRPGISDAGAVYVFHGKTKWTSPLQATSADLTVLGGVYGRFGIAVSAGDVNADGVDDLLVGASEVGAGGTRTRVGEAYAIFMSKSFPANHTIDMTITAANVRLTGRDYADRLGLSVSTGDPNGDGIDDLLVGSPMARPDGRANAGEVYAIWGRKSWPTGEYHIDLAVTTGKQPDLLIKGQNLYDRLSWSIACGDVNGDGVDDILTGAHRADPWSPTRAEGGKAFVFFGSKAFPSNHVIDMATVTPPVSIYGRAANDQFGFGCAIGDVDNDGKNDLVISASKADWSTRTDCGAVFVFRGPLSGPQVIDLVSAQADWEIYGPASDALLGGGAVALADEFNPALALGDFNRDAILDIAIGAPGLSPASRTHAGGAYVVYGGFTGWIDPPRVGTTARIQISAPAYPNTFRLGAAAFGGEFGIPIDTRVFPLNADPMFFFSLVVPTIFKDYTGFIDGNGRAVASIAIPSEKALVGYSLYTAFVLLDTSAPSGAASIGNRLPITFEP